VTALIISQKIAEASCLGQNSQAKRLTYFALSLNPLPEWEGIEGRVKELSIWQHLPFHLPSRERYFLYSTRFTEPISYSSNITFVRTRAIIDRVE